MIDIKAKIKERGYDYIDIASKIGVSKFTIAQWMSGSPRLWQLEKIAKALGITVSELVEDTYGDKVAKNMRCPCCGSKIHIKLSLIDIKD